MTKERLDELEAEFQKFGDRYIVDDGGLRSGHFTLLVGELRDLIATARRVERALQHVKALPTFDDPDQMGECLSDVEQILRGEA